MTYCVALFAVKTCEPMVRGGGRLVEEPRGMVFEPIMRAVAEGVREMGVPERVMIPPGVRVCESITYWDWLFGVMVWVPIVIIGRVVKAVPVGRIGSVVRIWEPWPFVVVKMTAGTWVMEDVMLPWAFVKLTTMLVEAVAAAVRRLLETTIWPCRSVEDATIGMIAAVPVITVVMPWAFVAVIVVGMTAIGEAVGLRAAGEGFVDVVTIALP